MTSSQITETFSGNNKRRNKHKGSVWNLNKRVFFVSLHFVYLNLPFLLTSLKIYDILPKETQYITLCYLLAQKVNDDEFKNHS